MSTHEPPRRQGTDVCLVSTLRDSLKISKLSLHFLHFCVDYKTKVNVWTERPPPLPPDNYVMSDDQPV